MAKEKPNQTRIYDKDGFKRRAAAICVKSAAESEILLVSSSRTPDAWVVPGGGVEPNEESLQAATRELMEEAGVRGVLSRSLGQFENSERRHRTSVFVLIVTEELDEWDDSKSIGRKRKWFQIEEAISLLADHKPVQVQYVKLLKNCKR